jgi:hypothetical protein
VDAKSHSGTSLTSHDLDRGRKKSLSTISVYSIGRRGEGEAESKRALRVLRLIC